MGQVDKTFISGYLQVHPDGYAFLVGEAPGAADLFIAPRHLGGAGHRDRVRAEVLPKSASPRHQRGGRDRTEGRVVEILARGINRVVGRFEQFGRTAQVIPDDARTPAKISIPPDGTGGARHGQTVVVQLLTFADAPDGATGKIVQIMGARNEFTTEVETVIHHHQLPTQFPADVESAASTLADASRTAPRDTHTDLRQIPFVTIDGETAKDFDDAVAVETHGADTTVWVAIADVSAYVAANSPIDREALARGTSVYFPDRCLPMLPSVLSDNLCSLRPNEDRLAVVVCFTVTPDGTIRDPHFARAHIRSRARLTYTIVHHLLAADDPVLAEEYRAQLPMLHTMATVCRSLQRVRRARGSIDFDLPEPQILLDIEGGPEAIVRAPRYFSHQMIEELMIATNEVVARHLTNHQYPCLFRCHPPPTPDRMRDFGLLCKQMGVAARLRAPVRALDLARVVETVKDRPEARLINHALLRSMQQAYYDPGSSHHFGLASACYCHFTSPIRRYPDLVVHRLLLATLDAKSVHGHGTAQPLASGRRALGDVALHCSRRERISMEAEREMAKVYTAAFMRERIGQSFDGVISHITKFGFYVELVEFFIEGFVPCTSLTDDRYTLDDTTRTLVGKRQGKVWQIGNHVRVQVHTVSLEHRETIFCLPKTA